MAAGRTIALAVLAACGAKPAELHQGSVAHIEPPPDRSEQHHPLVTGAPVPDVDLSGLIPDPTEEARWPLTMGSHPVLEPRFDIAAALAVPGITWMELCGRGAQNRHSATDRDLFQYLAAWCKVAQHDADGALGALAGLQRSVVIGLAPAVPLDIADILTDHGSADEAIHLLTRNHLDTPDVLDVLAATYVEAGRTSDAYELAVRAIAEDRRPREPTRCHRAARKIVLAESGSRASLVDEFRASVDNHHSSDPTCILLNAELRCWVAEDCNEYFHSTGAATGSAELVSVHRSWPTNDAPWRTWIDLARESNEASPVHGWDLLEVSALEAAIRVSRCAERNLDVVHDLARRTLLDSSHSPELEPRLAALIALTASWCEAVQSH